jgi:hypothetical protein
MMEAQYYDEEEATEEVQIVEEVLRLAYAEFRHWLPPSWQDAYSAHHGKLYSPVIVPGHNYWNVVFPIGAQMYVNHTAASLRLVEQDGSISLAALRHHIVEWLDAGADEGTTVRALYQEELERSGKTLPEWLLDEDVEWPEWLVDSDPDGM